RAYFDRLLMRTATALTVILAVGIFFLGRTYADVRGQVASEMKREILERFQQPEIDKMIKQVAVEQTSRQSGTVIENVATALVKAELTKRQQEIGQAISNAIRTEAIGRVAVAVAPVPPGTVVPFAGPTIPSGWLPCNGQAVTRKDYAALYSAIGQTYGNGDGVSTFNLPDYRGRFLRGVDGSANRDHERVQRQAGLGSIQDDEVGPHVHPEMAIDVERLGAGGGYRIVGAGSNFGAFQTQANGLVNQGKETRPINVAVNWIIKL
ncbi:MAG: phage tail protein, partial [Bryobacteraceae bacterium]